MVVGAAQGLLWGFVIVRNALAWALASRLIAGAALDVYESEPAVKAELLTLENVVLSPHLGSSTIETRTAMADLAASPELAERLGRAAIARAADRTWAAAVKALVIV